MADDELSQTAVTTRSLAPVELENSSDVQEFMGRAPHWLLRSGTTVFASVLAVLLTLSAIIKYPDTITARITVTGTQPVVEVVARQSGHLESLRVKEGQSVSKGEIMAIIQSPSNPATVIAIAEKLALISPGNSTDAVIFNVAFRPEEGLGTLQAPYADFLSSYQKLRDLLMDDYAEKTGALLKQQLASKATQIESLRQQTDMSRRELELGRDKFARLKALHESQSVSTSQLQDQEMQLLQQMKVNTTADRTLTDAQIESSKLEKELRDLEHLRTETLRTAREQLRAGVNKLAGEISVWAAGHILRAPSDGVVAFYDFWSDQQYVTAGREVFLIIPENTRLLGRMSVSQGGAGKIKPGQPVRMRLDDFPYKEFGIVSGQVQSVSMVARQGANLVLVDISYPLTTSFQKQLQFKQDMTGEGRVVTEDIRLLGRVLYEIRRAFVNNTTN